MNGKNKALIAILAVMLIGTGAYLWGQASKAWYGLPPKNQTERSEASRNALSEAGRPQPDSGRLAMGGRGGPFGGGPMLDEKERMKMADEIGLSTEQREKIDAIMKEGGAEANPRGRMEAMSKVLTPEQQVKAAAVIGARFQARMAQRKAEAKKRMTPTEFAEFERKLESRRARWGSMGRGGRGGEGGGRRGGSGGGGEPRPNGPATPNGAPRR